MGCGGSPKVTTQENKPLAEVRPYIQPYLNQAQTLSQREYTPYTGQRVANQNQDQLNATGGVRSAVDASRQTTQQAQQGLQSTASGAYLGGSGATNPFAGMGNPYLNKSVSDSLGDVTQSYQHATAPQTDASFARQGAFGGSAWADQIDQNNKQLGQTLGRVANDARMGQYGLQAQLAENQTGRTENAFQNERGRQMQAGQVASQLADSQVQREGSLFNFGSAAQRQDQQGLDNKYQDFMGAQNQDYRNLDVLGGAISRAGGLGNTQTQTQTGGNNPLAQIAGLAGNAALMFSGAPPIMPSTGGGGGCGGGSFGSAVPPGLI